MELAPKKLAYIGLICLALGFLFDYFFHNQTPGIAFVIYSGLLLAVFYLLAKHLKISFYKPTDRALKLLVLPIVFFSAMLAVRDSHFLVFWNVVATFGLLLVFAGYATGSSLGNYRIIDFLITAFILPLKFIGSAFVSLGRLVLIKKHFSNTGKAPQIIKGIAITLPILFLFLLLLSSADLVFHKLLADLFNWQINIESFAFWLRVLFVAFIWLGTYSYLFQKSSPAAVPVPVKESAYTFGKIETQILLGSINALFLIFVIIQIGYLFAGSNAIAKLGYTYAEYAHKGFAELIVVALVSFVIVFLSDKFTEKKDQKHTQSFKVLSAILVGLLMVIMASAFMRLALYEQAYGFTLLRLLVQSFIVWLSLIFLLLYYKIFKFLPESFFSFWSLMLVIAFFVFWNILNPDLFIARQNISQFAATNQLDTAYLSSLSADATPAIVELLDKPDLKDKWGIALPQKAKEILLQKFNYLEKAQSWQSFNISRNKALNLITGGGE